MIPDAATGTLEKFLADKVRPGSHILSDGWHGYRRLKQKGFEHTATAISKQDEPAHSLFPWVHITLSNLKRFLLGTHHKVEQTKTSPALRRRIQLQAESPKHGAGLDGSLAARLHKHTNRHLQAAYCHPGASLIFIFGKSLLPSYGVRVLKIP